MYSRNVRSAAVVAAVAATHPLMDFFTGQKTLFPQLPRGLAWYHRPTHDFLLETLCVIVAGILYRRSLPERTKRSPVLVLMLSLLVLVQASVDVYLASSRRGGWLATEVNSGRLFH
jgi:hypothetical protein